MKATHNTTHAQPPHAAETMAPWSVTSSARFDFAASCVAFLMAITIGGMIWQDITFFDGTMGDVKSGEVIAVVSDMENLVRRKSGSIPVWNAAAPQEKLHSGDYVFTDRGSSTKLTFMDQGQVELGENTMIQIERTQENASLKLMQGSVRTEASKGAKPLLIKLGKKGTLLRTTPSTEVQIHTGNNGDARVAILSGTAELVEGDKTVAVGPAQTVAMDAAGEVSAPKSIPLHLQKPAHEEVVTIMRNGSVEFSWDVSDNVGVMFELARDPQFKNIVFREDVSDDLLKIERPNAGVHYWRVIPQGTDASFVETRRLRIVVNEPPVLLWPENDAVIEKTSDKDVALLMLWKNGEEKASFDLEFAADRDFSSGVERFSADTAWLQAGALTEGEHFWRVRKKGQADLEWSAVWRFTVKSTVLPVEEKASPSQTDKTEELNEALPPPDLNDEYEFEAPAGDGAFLWEKFLGMGTAYAADANVQTIKWPAIPNAHAYFVQIATDNAFKKIVKETETYVAQFSFEGFKPGTYYLRIATRDKRKKQGAFSKPVRVVISYPAPRLVKPADGAKEIAGTMVEFDWRKVDGAKSYRVEFAHDRAFKKIARTENPPLSSLSLNNLDSGAYFWRVVAIFPPDGASKPSSVRAVNIEKAKAPPVAVAETKPVAPPPQTPPPPPPGAPVLEKQGMQEEPSLARQQVGTVIVGLAPSHFKYALEGSKANLDLDAKVFNSFFFHGRIPLPRRFEAYASLRRAATEMFSENEGGQRSLKLQFVSAAAGVTYSLLNASSVRDMWAGVRLGVQLQSMFRFTRETMRTIDVAEVMALGPALGLAVQTPLGKRYVAILDLNYVHFSASSLKKASTAAAELSVQQALSAKMFLNYGFRYEATQFAFKEANDGDAKNKTSSMMLGIGRHL